LHYVGKLTSKKYAKTVNLLCASNELFVKYQAEGGVLTPNSHPPCVRPWFHNDIEFLSLKIAFISKPEEKTGFPGFLFSVSRNPCFKILPRIGNTNCAHDSTVLGYRIFNYHGLSETFLSLLVSIRKLVALSGFVLTRRKATTVAMTLSSHNLPTDCFLFPVHDCSSCMTAPHARLLLMHNCSSCMTAPHAWLLLMHDCSPCMSTVVQKSALFENVAIFSEVNCYRVSGWYCRLT